jgi:3-oxoacyl-[acyl-carrier protein] reductase
MGRLEGKIAWITGAGSGIGATTARRFAAEGAIVAVNDLNETGGTQVVRQIREAGGQAEFFLGSVTDKARVQEIVQALVSKHGRLDLLINNAGVLRDAMMAKMTEEQWDTVIDTHLKGSWLCAKTALEQMKAQGSGVITNTSSTSARGNIGQVNYAAAKAGIWGLTKTLALEYGKYGIRVNAVAPGFIETPMTDQIPDQLRERAINNIPLRKIGQPEDVANLHLFLASEEAGYITGQIIYVDGGVKI